MAKNLLLAFMLTFSFPAFSQDQAGALSILKKMGFSTFQKEPMDFELQDLKSGQSKKLSDFKGKWIWLTFWATWCGPCKYELPMLESLHQEFKDQGFALLGISVDQAASEHVLQFIKQKDLTFFNLHDKDSQVAGMYSASAIPSIYVISPDFQLVGVFRGASEWDNPRVVAQLKELVKIKNLPALPAAASPATATGPASGPSKAAAAGVDMPPELVPPQMEFIPFWEVIKVKKKIELKVRVNWKGNPEDYLLQTPTLTLPEGVSLGMVSSYSQNSDQGSELIYIFPLTFEKEGVYALGPLEVSYQSRQHGGTQQFSRNKGITVTVEGPFGKRSWWFLGLGAGILLLLGAGFFHFLRPERSSSQPDPAAAGTLLPDKEKLQKVLQMKISGSRKEYYSELVRCNLELSREEGENHQKLKKLLEEVQYGDKELSSLELGHLENNIQRALGQNLES